LKPARVPSLLDTWVSNPGVSNAAGVNGASHVGGAASGNGDPERES
jgi:hypothetical protein